jgi:hypothetical protein
VIFVGIDDTDTLDTPGTNQLARALVARLRDRYVLVRITRHQLLFDPRVPYTSKNGSASILLEPRGSDCPLPALIDELQRAMRQWFVPGSDPGLCVWDAAAGDVPAEVIRYGRRCQRELTRQSMAHELAALHGMHLEGLGGTRDGVIGALAAVGLAATADDGRVVQLGEWPDDLSGPQPLGALAARGVCVRRASDGTAIENGAIDVGKHLRPNVVAGQIVQWVVPADEGTAPWQAVRRT